MKFYPNLGVYKASNVEFDPEKMQAYSYKWWRFVEKIGRTVVFNSYQYSSTTIRHQYKIRRVLSELGIDYISIEVPRGLQSQDAFKSAIDLYNERINELNEAIQKPRSQKAKNIERLEAIKKFEQKIKLAKSLERMRAS